MEHLLKRSFAALIFDVEDEYETVIAALTDYLAARPDNAHAWNNRGVAYREMDMPREARADFDRAVALSKSDALPLANRAELRRDLGDPVGALEDLNTAISIDPASSSLFRRRQQVNRELDRIEAASADDARATELEALLPQWLRPKRPST